MIRVQHSVEVTLDNATLHTKMFDHRLATRNHPSGASLEFLGAVIETRVLCTGEKGCAFGDLFVEVMARVS
jgi:hypothetical protein